MTGVGGATVAGGVVTDPAVGGGAEAEGVWEQPWVQAPRLARLTKLTSESVRDRRFLERIACSGRCRESSTRWLEMGRKGVVGCWRGVRPGDFRCVHMARRCGDGRAGWIRCAHPAIAVRDGVRPPVRQWRTSRRPHPMNFRCALTDMITPNAASSDTADVPP